VYGMAKLNLYYIESPFQLLSAFENISQYKNNYKIILRLNENNTNNYQLKLIAKNLRLNNITYIKIREKKSFYDYINIFRVIKKIFFSDYDDIYFGNYNSIIFKLVFKYLNTNIYLLDDGVGTLIAYEKLKRKRINMKFYTMFNLEKTDLIDIKIHRFENLINFFRHKQTNESHDIFIGTQFVNYGFLDEVDYINCIKLSVSLSTSQKIFYFPHRNESRSVINKIRYLQGVEIIDINLPLEYYLLECNFIPGKIFTLLSTAVFSINIFYPKSEITIMRPKIKEHKEKEDLLAQYDFLLNVKQFNINLIDMDS
jgi:hypothetical protein